MTNQRTIVWGYVLMIAAAAGNVAFHALSAPALPWSVVPLVVYVLGASLAMPSLTLMALAELFPARRGMAASCQAFVQTSGNALVIAVLAPLLWGSALALSLGMAGALLVGSAAFLAYGAGHRRALRRREVRDPRSAGPRADARRGRPRAEQGLRESGAPRRPAPLDRRTPVMAPARPPRPPPPPPRPRAGWGAGPGRSAGAAVAGRRARAARPMGLSAG